VADRGRSAPLRDDAHSHIFVLEGR
jgi:hypothetical protein